jgi:hypothetical protein
MRKAITTILFTTLLSSCVANDASLGSQTAAITGVGPMTDEVSTDLVADVTDEDEITQDMIDANPDAYLWLVEDVTDVDLDLDPCPSVVDTAVVDMARMKATTPAADVRAKGPTVVQAPKSAATRALIRKFITNSWSKLVKTGDVEAGKALSKLLANPTIDKEVGDALQAAAKAHPESATAAFKGFITWMKQQSSKKLVLRSALFLITSGAVFLFLDDVKDAIKQHIFGLETQAEKIEKLKEEVEKLKAQKAAKCNSEPSEGDEALDAELKAKGAELVAAIADYKAAVAELTDVLDQLEQALADIGLGSVEPDPK